MAHFMDKLALSFGWGPNPLKVVSVSWAEYKDRIEDDFENVAVAPLVQMNSEGTKTSIWEVVLHCTINTNSHSYSLQRCSTREESSSAAGVYRQKLPALVVAVGREFLNRSTLQKVTDLLRENPAYEAVHLAAHFGFLEAFKSEIIKRTINVGDSSEGLTALHIAVRQENERVMTAILTAGADVSTVDRNGNTALHFAATKTETLLISLNVEEHPALNIKNKEGKTPLMISAQNSRLDNVRCLLKLGANPNHEPESHPLYNTNQYKQWLKTIETCKDISSKDLSKGGSLLHWVKTRELMHLCLDMDITPNVTNSVGQTPLHVMVTRQRVPCLVTLLSRGADPNVQDDEGNTPLHLAAKLLTPVVVQALIVFGGNISVMNNFGESPRHIAASQRTDDPTQQNCRDQIIYLLHTVGAPRCTTRHSVCCEGCVNDGQFNGVPIYHKPLVRSRWVMDQLLELAQINQAIQWQSHNQPQLRGSGRVLCLDGGGIKGLVLCQQLFVLEEALGRPIGQCFDWICGTSTGGFLALMLSNGKSVSDVQTLYYSLKEKVFSGSRPYDSTPLEDMLRKEFGEEATMSSIKGLKVMVTSTLADRLPPDLHLFRNYESPMSVIGLPESTHFNAPLSPDKQKIWLAARSSGAAPTYFSALDQFVDGGLIANNPTLDTLTEIEEWNMAVKSKGRHDEVFTPTVIVSLGCGKAPLTKVDNVDVVVPSILDMRRGFQAVYNIFNLLVDSACPSQGRVVDRARAWCSALNVPLFRLNPQLSSDINLDESSDEKLLRTMWEARAEMQRNSKMVEHLKYLLLPPSSEVKMPVPTSISPSIEITNNLVDPEKETDCETTLKPIPLQEKSKLVSCAGSGNSSTNTLADEIKSLTADTVTDGKEKSPSDIMSCLIPQLSVPNLSELLARSGVDPSSLASSMPDVLDSLSRRSVSPLDPKENARLSDPPGFPYILNDSNVQSFQPVNLFDTSGGLGSGFYPDSPASVRSLKSLEEKSPPEVLKPFEIAEAIQNVLPDTKTGDGEKDPSAKPSESDGLPTYKWALENS